MTAEKTDQKTHVSTFLISIVSSYQLDEPCGIPENINWQKELDKFNHKNKLCLSREELLDEANKITNIWEGNRKENKDLYKQQIAVAWSIYTQLWPETTEI